MMTKKSLCEAILREFAMNTLKIPTPIDINSIPIDSIHLSSRVAVAMEYLGMLHNKDDITYASSRGGILMVTSDENGDLMAVTYRDIIESLPD